MINNNSNNTNGGFGSTYQIPGVSTSYGGQTDPQVELYREMMKSRMSTAMPQYRTVFNDIADEWMNCSEEERRFIEQDQEYALANLTYSQQFNAFLLDQFGLQFANSKYGASAEKVLLALKNARSRFHSSTIEDMTRIKNENAALQRQLRELEDLIGGVTGVSAAKGEGGAK